MGEKGLEVEGRVVMDVFLGVRIESAAGAVCGEVLEREFGKFKVTSAR